MTGESRPARLHSAIKVQVAAGAIRGDWQCVAPDGRRRWLLSAKLGEAFTGGWWQSERSLSTAEAEAFVNGVSAGLSAVSEKLEGWSDWQLAAFTGEMYASQYPSGEIEGSALAALPPGCTDEARLRARAEDLRVARFALGLPSLGGDPFAGPE